MIELASVIKDLRNELQAAIEAGRDEALAFELGPIELEVSVAVDRSDEVGGKVRFWVVELGAERKQDTATTQHLRLTLTPRLSSTGQAPTVSGHAEPGER